MNTTRQVRTYEVCPAIGRYKGCVSLWPTKRVNVRFIELGRRAILIWDRFFVLKQKTDTTKIFPHIVMIRLTPSERPANLYVYGTLTAYSY